MASSQANTPKAPRASDQSKLEAYYSNLQTVFWFDHVLGGARHFGYYESGNSSPFPLHRSLQRMEAQLFDALALPAGSKVLDAGCGAGHVAAFMARQGLHVTAIDVVPRHVQLTVKTQARLASDHDIRGSVVARQMDYHHIDPLLDGTFDGVYTIEALVHATDPSAVLAGFLRTLKPGGHIVMHEYEQDLSQDEQSMMAIVNDGFSMAMNAVSRPGILRDLLERVGFQDVKIRDLSENVRPMTRMNYAISIVPYSLLKPLGLAKHSLNAVAGVELYKNQKRGLWKYIQISARKPGEEGTRGDEA